MVKKMRRSRRKRPVEHFLWSIRPCKRNSGSAGEGGFIGWNSEDFSKPSTHDRRSGVAKEDFEKRKHRAPEIQNAQTDVSFPTAPDGAMDELRAPAQTRELAEVAKKRKEFTAEERALQNEAKSLLKQIGESQAEQARITGKSQPVISRIMSDESKATLSFVNQLRLQAGEAQSLGTLFEQEMRKVLAGFPETYRKAVEGLILAFAQNLQDKFNA